MRRVRLLPIVICAAGALLVFKTVGIITNGGYVLSSVTQVQASSAPPAEAPAGAAAAGADGGITIPSEPTMTDGAPTLTDAAPTLGQAAGGAEGHPAPAAEGGNAAPAPDTAAAGDHGAPAPAAADAAAPAAAEAGHGAPAADGTKVADANAPGTVPDATAAAAAVPAANCPVEVAAPAAEGEKAAAPAAAPAAAAGDHSAAGGEAAGTEVHCLDLTDAQAVREDGKGNLVPLSAEEGALVTQKALLARLSDRRTELDSLQTELDMRSALVTAAEKRLEERAAAVSAMEAQINSLVAQKKAADDAQLKSIVSMYESMKPKDAATVFNSLDMDVLLKVARSMNPRKMAAVMAKMDPKRATDLTVNLAAVAPQPTVVQAAATGQDLSALPQIVGQ